MKVFNRKDLRSKGKKFIDYFKTEIDILKNLDHPNIIKYNEVRYDEQNIYVSLEYAEGGDLGLYLDSMDIVLFISKRI